MALLATLATVCALVPAPPVVHYVHTPNGIPGATGTELAHATVIGTTVYYAEPLDDFSRAHEVAHVFDNTVLTDGDRVYFTRLLGLSGAWNQGTGLTAAGLRSPNEWFADYYAAAAIRLDPRRENVSSYAQVTPKRFERFKKALARLGKRHNLEPYRHQ